MSKLMMWFVAFIVVFSFSFKVSGAETCSNSSVKIEQVQTVKSTAGSKPEWKVNVTNTCLCSISHLTLACPNFQPSIAVISIDANKNCLISNDVRLRKGESITFTYVADRVDFRTLDFYAACS